MSKTIETKIVRFLQNDPTEDEIEAFYIAHVLPRDKRSISEILHTENERKPQ